MTPEHVGVEAEMNPQTTCEPSQTATSFADTDWCRTTKTTDPATGTACWSFASPTAAAPPPRTSSAASMIVVPGPMIIVQRYEYTGRELASGSGEYYFRFRVYGAALGQFFTRDPLGYVDGMGLYAGRFAQYFERDPWGEVKIDPIVDCTSAEAQAIRKAVAASANALKKAISLYEELTYKKVVDSLGRPPHGGHPPPGENWLIGQHSWIRWGLYRSGMRDRLRCMRDKLDTGIAVECECSCTTRDPAYRKPFWSPDRIHLCPSAWKPGAGPLETTITHEVSHMCGTGDLHLQWQRLPNAQVSLAPDDAYWMEFFALPAIHQQQTDTIISLIFDPHFNK